MVNLPESSYSGGVYKWIPLVSLQVKSFFDFLTDF